MGPTFTGLFCLEAVLAGGGVLTGNRLQQHVITDQDTGGRRTDGRVADATAARLSLSQSLCVCVCVCVLIDRRRNCASSI